MFGQVFFLGECRRCVDMIGVGRRFDMTIRGWGGYSSIYIENPERRKDIVGFIKKENIMRCSVWLGVVVVISGCANVQVEPPEQSNVERSRVYSMSYDKTWSRAVDWYADHNVTIEKIRKESGLLTAKYSLEASSDDLDCGEINATGFLKEPEIDRAGSLNLTVRRLEETRTKVKVNFFGEYELSGKDAWDGRTVTYSGNCRTTGEIEENILDYIGS